MDELNTFYSLLGKLSVKFAIVEQNAKNILDILITQNKIGVLISKTLTEEFSLSKTLQAINKMNKITNDFEDDIKALNSKTAGKLTYRCIFLDDNISMYNYQEIF